MMKTETSGFTLVEMMVTIAVLAILAAIAIPSYRSLILNSRMTAQANEFLTALSFARSEAIKRNTNVTLSANTGGWANGWVIADAGGTTLREHPALEGGSSLSGGGTTTITFTSNGRASTGLTFNLCSPYTSIAPGRDIVVDASGRARINKPGTCS